MTKVNVAVIGGGITGQLVKFLIPTAHVYDWNPMKRTARPLTRSYGANYLWKPLPGIPHREFPVVTHVDGHPATPESVRAYKIKVGRPPGDEWGFQFTESMTGYDFTSLPDVAVHYDHRVTSIDRLSHTITFAKQGDMQYDLLISTIPLYTLLSMADIEEPMNGLKFKPIFFRVARRPPDAPFPPETMYVNYLSSPDVPPYRFCDRNGERHYESIVPFDGPATKRFSPGKIYPHPSVPDVLDVLAGFNIYTFGRFGSWNPDELIHETYEEIAVFKEAMSI